MGACGVRSPQDDMGHEQRAAKCVVARKFLLFGSIGGNDGKASRPGHLQLHVRKVALRMCAHVEDDAEGQ